MLGHVFLLRECAECLQAPPLRAAWCCCKPGYSLRCPLPGSPARKRTPAVLELLGACLGLPKKLDGRSSTPKSKLPAAEALQPPRAAGDGNTQCTVKHPLSTRAALRHTGLFYRMCMFPRMCQNAATAMQAILACELLGLQSHAHATHASEHPCSMLSTPPPGQLLAATILLRAPRLAPYCSPYNVSPTLSPHPSYKCTVPSAPSTNKPFLQPNSWTTCPSLAG